MPLRLSGNRNNDITPLSPDGSVIFAAGGLLWRETPEGREVKKEQAAFCEKAIKQPVLRLECSGRYNFSYHPNTF